MATILSLSIAFLHFWPSSAVACSVCMGANSKTGPAINAAIFLMLGFVALILGSLGAFAYNLARRAKSPLPPHAEFSQVISDPDETN